MSAPNVLLIMTDQQSAGALSCAGNAHLRTPNMDALAAAGVRFARSYCGSPVCGPSRACLLTGRLPHETGVLHNSQPPEPSFPSLGELFQRAGYDTGWSGRWHFPKHGPELRGFERLHGDEAAIWSGVVGDGAVTDAAIDFLQRRRERPFLLGVSFCNPHDICGWISEDPPVPNDVDSLPPLPDNFAIDPDEPEFIQQCRQRTYYGNEGNCTFGWSDPQWRTYLRAYYDFVEAVDAQVGRLLAALRSAGLEDDTLVLFTSDHGEGMAGHHWVVKLMLWEEPVTVPFVLRWPGQVPVGVVDRDQLVSGLDVLPTLCDWAGVGFPQVTGISLKPLLRNGQGPGRPHVASELYPDTKDPTMQARMLRTRRHKYVAFSSGRRPELLFDMHTDPGETRNLATQADHTGELARHRALLRQWCTETADPFADQDVLR